MHGRMFLFICELRTLAFVTSFIDYIGCIPNIITRAITTVITYNKLNEHKTVKFVFEVNISNERRKRKNI